MSGKNIPREKLNMRDYEFFTNGRSIYAVKKSVLHATKRGNSRNNEKFCMFLVTSEEFQPVVGAGVQSMQGLSRVELEP